MAESVEEICRLERLILFFAKQKRLLTSFPTQYDKSVRLDTMVQVAEKHLAAGRYGKAISAYRNSLLYFKTWEYEMHDRHTCNSFFATIECQITMSLLLLGNCRDALDHANRCIVHEPSLHLIHIWRAFAFRRLGYYARAVKSLTVRVPLFLRRCLQDYWGDVYRFVSLPTWNFYEEDVVTAYWRAVYSVLTGVSRSYKVDHFEEIPYFSSEESYNVLSLQFLQRNPAYHYAVLVDRSTRRVLPDTHCSILHESNLRFFHQATGFTEKTPGLPYFSEPSKSSKYLLKRMGRSSSLKIRQQFVDKLRYIAEMSDVINCTSYEMRLLAGFGIHERLILCSALVLNSEFEEALLEYRCLKADISLFGLLGSKADLKHHMSSARHLNAIRKIVDALKVRVEMEYDTMRSIGHITQRLQTSAIAWLQKNPPVQPKSNKKTPKKSKIGKDRRSAGEWKLSKSSPQKIRLHRRGSF